MTSRKELLQSPEYWFEHVQNDVYRILQDYMEKEKLNQTQLAERLGVSKGYVSQVLRGEFNYSLKKLIELGVSVGYVPQIEFKSLEEVFAEDNKSYHLEASPLQVSSNEPQFVNFFSNVG